MLSDAHVHLAALPAAGNGCLASRRQLRRWLTRLVAWQQGLPLRDPARANALYLERLEEELARSRRVGRAVLLPLDGVYGSDGRLDEARTHFLVSNDYALSCARRPRFLAGASVNPARRDALEELERVAGAGAVLVKLLPNVQGIDLSQARFKPFFRALGRLRLPLLVHVGAEMSLGALDQSLGDPERLRAALEEGATVIAAHGCSDGTLWSRRYVRSFLSLCARYPRLYADTSALTLPNRLPAALFLRRHPEIFDRLVFGTDYPLPCWSWGLPAARKADNRFDRQALALEGLGLPAGRDVLELR